MPLTQSRAQPILTSAAAHLYVRDVQVSTEFFTQKLGFTTDFVYGNPPFYGEVSRDNAKLVLRLVHEPVFTDGVREREDLLSATITLGHAEEIEQLFLEWRAAGFRFIKT